MQVINDRPEATELSPHAKGTGTLASSGHDAVVSAWVVIMFRSASLPLRTCREVQDSMVTLSSKLLDILLRFMTNKDLWKGTLAAEMC